MLHKYISDFQTPGPYPRGLGFLRNFKPKPFIGKKSLSIPVTGKFSKIPNKFYNKTDYKFVIYEDGNAELVSHQYYKRYLAEAIVKNKSIAKFQVVNGALNIFNVSSKFKHCINRHQLTFIDLPSTVHLIKVLKYWATKHELAADVKLSYKKSKGDVNKFLKLLIYPGLLNLENYPNLIISNYITGTDRLKNPKLTETQYFDFCFGSHGKSLKKTIKLASDFEVGRTLKGILTIQDIITVLDNRITCTYLGTAGTFDDIKRTREFFSLINPKTLKNALLNTQPTKIQRLGDCLNIYKRHRKDLTVIQGNIDEIHDDLVKQSLKLKTEQFKIKTNDKAISALDKKPCGKFTIKVPEANLDLAEWGYALHHCVGSYGSLINSGKLEVIALMQDNAPVYTISIKDKKIDQFYGKFNISPSQEDKNLVINYLIENKVLNRML